VKKQDANTPTPPSQIPSFASLEGFIRDEVQRLVQRLLDQEATEHLGRERYQRVQEAEAAPQEQAEQAPPYRNGHGKPRHLTLPIGTIEVRRPRFRNLSECFESRVLPLFQRRSQLVTSMLPELYLHGLALRDFDMALRGLLGEEAALSPSSIARLKDEWREEYEAWRKEPIVEAPLYLWADGVYVKAGLEKDKAAVLVVVGAFADGTKRVLAAEPGFRESKDSWKEVLGGLVKRGMKAPRILVADGGLGLWAAASELGWPCLEQRCWKHKTQNVLDVLPSSEQKTALKLLRSIPQSKTREEAEARRDGFIESYKDRHPRACERLSSDWERMVAFYQLPREHWKHLRTSNVVESPFQIVRLRTGAARRFKKAENASAIIWKLLMVAEKTFRRLDKIYLLEDLLQGTQYVNGVAIRTNAA
jgi:transposase-like protein